MTAVVYHTGDRQALSTARLRRTGQLETADSCRTSYTKIMGEWRFSERQCIVRMKYVYSATSFRKGLFLNNNIVLCAHRR